MGSLYKRSIDIIEVEPGDVFVEIGSAQGWDGSTHFLNSVARNLGTVLYSVDIDERSDIFQYVSGVIGVQMSGSQWAKDVFPGLDQKIALLYLDNFDWDWNNQQFQHTVDQQKIEYQTKFGVSLSNSNSQIEHLSQMIHLLPYMSNNGIVICDDTLMLSDNTWTGKCGPVVVYLQAMGWKILEVESEPGSFAVMLGRNH
jgi:hypothetical protein